MSKIEEKPVKTVTKVKETPKKKVTTTKQTSKTVELKSQKPFVHPAETWWGKAVVWFIIFGMVGLVVLSFILALVNSQA